MKNKRGITLIALVITIIVLLILAGISLSLTLGENGILSKAKISKSTYDISDAKESVEIEAAAYVGEYYEKKAEGSTTDALDDYVAGKLLSHNGEKHGEYVLGVNGKDVTLTLGNETVTGSIGANGAVVWSGAVASADTNNQWGGMAAESEVEPDYFEYEVLTDPTTVGTTDKYGTKILATVADLSGNIKIAEETMGTVKITGLNNAGVYADIGGDPEAGSAEGKADLYIEKAKERLARIVIPATVKLKNGKVDSTGTEYKVVGVALNQIAPYDDYGDVFGVETDIILPNTITKIDDGAFSGNKSLKSIIIPDGVLEVGDEAFNSCENLVSVTLGNTITTIGDAAFAGCNITEIVLPDSVTTIADNAFASTDISEITIPAGVTSIGDWVFYGCYYLSKITVMDGNNNYISVNDVLFDKNKTKLIRYPIQKTGDSYDIPNTVTSIEDGAFSGCNNLTQITIPDSVTRIGSSAFGYCRNLTQLPLPDGLTSIGHCAFDYCTKVTSIVVPSGVTAVGPVAFQGWTNKQTINIRAASIPSGWTSDWCSGNSSPKIVMGYTGE